MEMEIAPIRKADTYEKEIQCDLPMPGALRPIPENEDFGGFQDDADSRFDQISRQPSGSMPRRQSTMDKHGKIKLGPKQTEKDVEEIKVVELSKHEAESIIKTPDFQGFFENSSRLMERALG